MAQIPLHLHSLAAEAAHALRGYLDALGAWGVTGLPAPRVRVAPPAPRPVTAAPAPRPAEPRSAAPAAVAPPVTGNALPWERYTKAAPPETAAAPPAPRPAVPAAAAPAPPAPVPAAPPAVSARRAEVVLPTVERTLDATTAALRLIREDLGECQRCKLCKARKHIVFGVGSPLAEVCFVGEGPGADEDLQGEPFVGAAGQLLTQMIRAMGYAREDVYICNVVKCRPPNNRDPEEDEVQACEPFLLRQIAVVQPKVVVALGRHAAATLLKQKVAITRLRGTWMEYRGIPLMPTFHPSYLLRTPAAKREAWEDLKAVMRHLGKPVPEKRGG